MQPYVESGASAQRSLQKRSTDPERQRLASSARAFEHVIRLVGGFALVMIPLFGVMARSTEVAAIVAGNFLLVIVLLDLLSLKVRRTLRQRAAGSSQY